MSRVRGGEVQTPRVCRSEACWRVHSVLQREAVMLRGLTGGEGGGSAVMVMSAIMAVQPWGGRAALLRDLSAEAEAVGAVGGWGG